MRRAGDGIPCPECGREFLALSGHVYYTHGMTVYEAYAKHHIPLGTPTVVSELSELFRREASKPERLAKFAERARTAENLQHLQEAQKTGVFATRIKELYAVRTPSAKQIKHGHELKCYRAASEAEHRKMRLSKGSTVIRTCAECGSEYEAGRSRRLKFCTEACFNANKVGKSTLSEEVKMRRDEQQAAKRRRTCPVCNAEFIVKCLTRPTRFCSSTCANSMRKRVGGKFTDDPVILQEVSR